MVSQTAFGCPLTLRILIIRSKHNMYASMDRVISEKYLRGCYGAHLKICQETSSKKTKQKPLIIFLIQKPPKKKQYKALMRD